jgi:hypothetical protein
VEQNRKEAGSEGREPSRPLSKRPVLSQVFSGQFAKSSRLTVYIEFNESMAFKRRWLTRTSYLKKDKRCVNYFDRQLIRSSQIGLISVRHF